jgi:DNA processing protein
VLAGGLDRVYPPDNEGLLARIVDEGGAALSEMPLGWEARGRDFPRRNRLVSGLSYGVVVVEAARRSASLITARYALEQGREVLAVPGSPLNPPSVRHERPDPRRRHALRRSRARARRRRAVDRVEHALRATSPPGRVRRRHAGPTWDDDEGDTFEAEPDAEPSGGDGSEVEALLGSAPVSIGDLARQSGLPIRAVRLALLELELAGRLERHGGHAVSLLTN